MTQCLQYTRYTTSPTRVGSFESYIIHSQVSGSEVSIWPKHPTPLCFPMSEYHAYITHDQVCFQVLHVWCIHVYCTWRTLEAYSCIVQRVRGWQWSCSPHPTPETQPGNRQDWCVETPVLSSVTLGSATMASYVDTTNKATCTCLPHDLRQTR